MYPSLTIRTNTVLLALLCVGGVLAAWLVTGTGTSNGQRSLSSTTTSDAPRPKLQGIAMRKGEQLLLQTEDSADIALRMGAGATAVNITRDSQHVALNEIQNGDLLNVALNHDGTVYRLDALSASNPGGTVFRTSWLQRALPLVYVLSAVGLSLLVIAGGMRRRRHATVRAGNTASDVE